LLRDAYIGKADEYSEKLTYTLIYGKITPGAATMLVSPSFCTLHPSHSPLAWYSRNGSRRQNTEKTQCNINAGGEEGKR